MTAEQFLSLGTVFQFYLKVSQPGWGLDSDMLRRFPVRYRNLIRHLKKVSTVRLNVLSWRVRQAYQSPHNQLDMFRHRMEQSRVKLAERVEQILTGETWS